MDNGRADEQDVGGLVEEPQRRQVADQSLVDAGLGGVVEVGQGVAGGQAGEVGARGQPAGLGGGDLDREQPFQGGRGRQRASLRAPAS